MKISDNFVMRCYNAITGWTALRPPSVDSVRPIVETCEPLIEESVFYTRPAKTQYDGLDTGERDLLFDAVGKYFVGENWPTNMDGQEKMIEFRSKLAEAIKDHGWTIAP